MSEKERERQTERERRVKERLNAEIGEFEVSMRQQKRDSVQEIDWEREREF